MDLLSAASVRLLSRTVEPKIRRGPGNLCEDRRNASRIERKNVFCRSPLPRYREITLWRVHFCSVFGEPPVEQLAKNRRVIQGREEREDRKLPFKQSVIHTVSVRGRWPILSMLFRYENGSFLNQFLSSTRPGLSEIRSTF